MANKTSLSARIAGVQCDVTDLYLDYNSLAIAYIIGLAHQHFKGGPRLEDCEPGLLKIDAIRVRRFLEDRDFDDPHSEFDKACRVLLGALVNEPQHREGESD